MSSTYSVPILPDSSLSAFLPFPVSTLLSCTCTLSFCVCIYSILLILYVIYIYHLFMLPCLCIRMDSWWLKYPPYGCCSSINSVTVPLSLLPSVHIPYNQCPVHPTSPYFLAVLFIHAFIPCFQLSFHHFTQTTHVLSALNLSISIWSLSLLAFNVLICSLQVYLVDLSG